MVQISKINSIVNKLISKFLNISLSNKVILGYIFVIFIPNVTSGLLAYTQYISKVKNEYIERKQQVIERSINYLQYDLLRVSGFNRLFQTNTKYIEYLSAYPENKGEYVYNYIKYIRPLHNYIYSINPFISNITIYTNNPKVFPIGTEIMNRSEATDIPEEIDNIIPPNGIWKCTNSDILNLPHYTYYQTVFDENYSNKLGVIAITVNDTLLSDFLMTLSSNLEDSSSILLIADDGSLLFQSRNNGLSLSQDEIRRYILEQSSNFYKVINSDGKRIILNVMRINDLNTYLAIIEDTAVVFRTVHRQIVLLISLLVLLLLILTIFYYLFTMHITIRVTRLANYMKSVNKENLDEYYCNPTGDEIGNLISSYNSMIKYIRELIVKVQQEEIMRREASYRALQAQIKPHFLYGTLETIRMLAITNNDNEVAGIAFSLGKMMRYALSMKEHVYLKDEIENVRSYLQIYKARMEEKLKFNIVINDPSIANEFPCPQFILQPIVENSIKHGIRKISGVGVIQIGVINEDSYVLITVKDNGIGIPADQLQYINGILENTLDIKEFIMDNSGFALYNIKERIKSFYGAESCISLQSCKEGGTLCIMKLAKRVTDQ